MGRWWWRGLGGCPHFMLVVLVVERRRKGGRREERESGERGRQTHGRFVLIPSLSVPFREERKKGKERPRRNRPEPIAAGLIEAASTT